MIKICFIASTLNVKTGWGRLSAGLIDSLKQGGEVEIVSVVEEGEAGDLAILPKNKKNLFKLIPALIKLFKISQGSDIVHALDGWPYGFYGALTGKPLLITLIGTYSFKPIQRLKLGGFLRFAYRRAVVLASISGYTADLVGQKVPEIKNKIRVIHPGVNEKFFGATTTDHRDNYILSVGTIEPRKGYEVSIQAFAELAKNHPELKYRIIGNKDKRHFKVVAALIKKFGIEDKIVILNNVNEEELLNFYRKAKLFLLHPLNMGGAFEGFGLAYLEAAAAGLPIVGTLGNGSEDAVSNNHNGTLVRQGDVDGTADAMRRILNDQNLYSRMSRNSIEWAERHNAQKTAQEYLRIYKSIHGYN